MSGHLFLFCFCWLDSGEYFIFRLLPVLWSKRVSCSPFVCADKEIKDLIDNHSHYSLRVFSASVSLRVEVWGKPSLFYGVTYAVYCDIGWGSSGLLSSYW